MSPAVVPCGLIFAQTAILDRMIQNNLGIYKLFGDASPWISRIFKRCYQIRTEPNVAKLFYKTTHSQLVSKTLGKKKKITITLGYLAFIYFTMQLNALQLHLTYLKFFECTWATAEHFSTNCIPCWFLSRWLTAKPFNTSD